MIGDWSTTVIELWRDIPSQISTKPVLNMEGFPGSVNHKT